MLTMETIARVWRERARGKSVRAIARDLRLSRGTVTKYLRSGETEAKYERRCQPYPQLGPFLADLEELLERNGQPPRDRLDKRQLFEALRRAGYAGGYDAVRRYARRWADIRATKTQAKASGAFIPLTVGAVVRNIAPSAASISPGRPTRGFKFGGPRPTRDGRELPVVDAFLALPAKLDPLRAVALTALSCVRSRPRPACAGRRNRLPVRRRDRRGGQSKPARRKTPAAPRASLSALLAANPAVRQRRCGRIS